MLQIKHQYFHFHLFNFIIGPIYTRDTGLKTEKSMTCQTKSFLHVKCHLAAKNGEVMNVLIIGIYF